MCVCVLQGTEEEGVCVCVCDTVSLSPQDWRAVTGMGSPQGAPGGGGGRPGTLRGGHDRLQFMLGKPSRRVWLLTRSCSW